MSLIVTQPEEPPKQTEFDLSTVLDKKQLVFLAVANGVLQKDNLVSTLTSARQQIDWLKKHPGSVCDMTWAFADVDRLIDAASVLYDRVQERA